MADASKPSLTLSRRYASPPARVFAAWTEPALIAQWWQPRPAAAPTQAEIDLRVGGRYRIVMQATDGETLDVGGEYQVVETDRRLVFTWAWASTPQRVSLVTVDFAADGDGTLLTLTHERFFDAAARDGHRGGWTTLLGTLALDLDDAPARP
jgi:uncharacterized protein YndB with AHSA1/START domain